MKKTKKYQYAYMCKTDFEYDMESTDVRIFPTIKSLKKHYKCLDECGFVKVKISLERIVKKGKF